MTQTGRTTPRASFDDVEFFSALPTEERQKLAERCVWRRFGPNEPIIDGDPCSSHGVFVLTEGIVKLSQRNKNSDLVPVGWLSAPACFGEFAAIMSCPGATSVRTSTNCEVAEFSEATFNRLLNEYPSLLLKLLKKAISIVRELDDNVVRLHHADALLADAHRKAVLRSL